MRKGEIVKLVPRSSYTEDDISQKEPIMSRTTRRDFIRTAAAGAAVGVGAGALKAEDLGGAGAGAGAADGGSANAAGVSKSDIVEYELLLPYQFERRVEQCPLIYIPVGALEWHGEHMALGNDSIKMHAICREAARRGGGVVFPPVFYGVPFMVGFGKKYQFKANVPVTEPFLEQLLNTTLGAMEEVGFKAAIVITGHTSGEQMRLMKRVAQNYQGKMKVYGTYDNEWGKEINYTSDHAAMWETSILSYLHPELVEMDRLPKDVNVKLEGVGGKDPRIHASPELGKKAIDAVSRDLAALGQRLLSDNEQS